MTTFLHTSDWQIGMQRWFFSEEDQALYEDSRIQSIRDLGRIAHENGCEFIVVAGDVFDCNSLRPRTIERALEALGSLPMPVFLLPGNHDPLTADSALRRIDKEGVTVLKDSTPIPFKDIEIVGAPLTSKRASEDLVARALSELEPTDKIRVMVAHGQAESYGAEIDVIDLTTVQQALADGRIDYLALGDTHSALEVADRVWFSGSPVPTDFHDLASGGGENNSGKALVVKLEKGEAEVSEVPVSPWTFDAITMDINSIEDVQAFIAQLESYPDKRHTVIKYGLRGTIDTPAMQLLEKETERLRHLFAALYERKSRMDLVYLPGEEDIINLDVHGYAADTLQELCSVAASSADDLDALAAQDALRLFFRLAKES